MRFLGVVKIQQLFILFAKINKIAQILLTQWYLSGVYY